MTTSQTKESKLQPGGITLGRVWKQLVEWLVWVSLGAVVYLQTDVFDREIAEYTFGADGWPKALCIAIFIGATGQLIYQVLQLSRGVLEDDGAIAETSVERKPLSPWRILQRLGIFCFPLLYLYLIPTMGFYFVTPFFLLGMLLILEVRSPVALVTVTSVVYGFFLLIFTRFFYVAVPVGQVEPFYSINNAIIIFARSGL